MSSPDVRDREFDDWPVAGREDSDVQYVGTTGGAGVYPGAFVFYDPEKQTLFGGTPDRETETIVPDDDAEWELHPEETVGEALDRLGEELQWESLSAFAEDHLLEEESDE